MRSLYKLTEGLESGEAEEGEGEGRQLVTLQVEVLEGRKVHYRGR